MKKERARCDGTVVARRNGRATTSAMIGRHKARVAKTMSTIRRKQQGNKQELLANKVKKQQGLQTRCKQPIINKARK